MWLIPSKPSPLRPSRPCCDACTSDLIGLPPTADDLHRFEADRSPDAYERVVDQLLATPQYGERWGRHLMDIWRYSEADGRKSPSLIWWSDPMVWRWRDWIVGSLNADKGYDRMILEMLAGDELPDQSVETQNRHGFSCPQPVRSRSKCLAHDAIEHTGKAFLGLTINLRTMSRSQVRSDHPERVLPISPFLRGLRYLPGDPHPASDGRKTTVHPCRRFASQRQDVHLSSRSTDRPRHVGDDYLRRAWYPRAILACAENRAGFRQHRTAVERSPNGSLIHGIR